MASNLPMFGLRMTRQTLDKLKYIAEYNGRSSNKEIEQLVLKHVDQFEKEHGRIHLDEETPKID